METDSVLAALSRQTDELVERLFEVFLDYDFNEYNVLDGQLTGGQVLTYLCREGDRMADELLRATGQPVPEPERGRRWEIAEGGHLRPGAVLVEDLRESCARLEDALAQVDDWSALREDARAIPARRLLQVIVHHVDLGRPWDELADEDAAIASRVLSDVLAADGAARPLVTVGANGQSRGAQLGETSESAKNPAQLIARATGRTVGVARASDTVLVQENRTWI